MSDLNQQDLDAIRAQLLKAILRHVPFDGWSAMARDKAASDLDLDHDIAALALPEDKMLDVFYRYVDDRMVDQAGTMEGMRINQMINHMLLTRLDILAPHREAVRRAVQMSPLKAGASACFLWRTADLIWKKAGDQAMDYNHYSKRAILSGIYAATLVVWLQDDSNDKEQTRAFLENRITGVLRFEKAKTHFAQTMNKAPSLIRFLSRLRYHSQ